MEHSIGATRDFLGRGPEEGNRRFLDDVDEEDDVEDDVDDAE